MSEIKRTKKQRKIQRTKNLIIVAASELFSKKPYEDVSMEDIADKAVLSKATIYKYFQNKETIYFSVGIRGLEDTIKKRMEIFSLESSGKDQFIELSKHFIEMESKNPLGLKILRQFNIKNNQAKPTAEEILEKLKKSRKKPELFDGIEIADQVFARYLEKYLEYRELYLLAIKGGIKDGSIQTNLAAEQLYQFLNVTVVGIFDQIELQKIPINQVNLTKNSILNLLLKLIESILRGF
jgi:AcrR family transcriptional regulator